MRTKIRGASAPKAEVRPAWIADAVASLPAIALIAEVASTLRMSTRSVRRLVHSNQIRAVRARESGAARVLIPRAEVARYLASLEAGTS